MKGNDRKKEEKNKKEKAQNFGGEKDIIEKVHNLEKMLKEMKEENKKYKEENEKYKEKNEKEKKQFLKLVGILTEINFKNEKYLKNNVEIKINNLKNKLELITNSYKVLYIRKLSNIFLNELYERYYKKKN